MIQVSHESPICMLQQSKLYNDYDYALVHLFDTHEEYYKYFKDSVTQGERKVYLDNSIFELGKSFDPVQYLKWIVRLNPTYYIVPDVLEDADGTISSLFNFKQLMADSSQLAKYNAVQCDGCEDTQREVELIEDSSGEYNMNSDATMLEIANSIDDVTSMSIGVVQGRDWNDLVECYQVMSKTVDMIAISFDYSYYLHTGVDDTTLPRTNVNWYDVLYGEADLPISTEDPLNCTICKNKLHRYATGRQQFIRRLIDEQVWNWNKPHHLLGCSLAKEFSYYVNPRTRVDNIVSIDTSNPVMSAIKGVRYNFDAGLPGKPRGLLADNIDIKYSDDELRTIMRDVYFNTDMFKKIINR